MNAIDLLTKDHKHLKTLLAKAATAKGEERREELIETLRSELVAHERMEEEVFYPPLRENKKTHDIVLEGYQEHHVADLILDELLELPADSEMWQPKVKVLQENIEHHIEEEEGEMFKKARSIFSEEELEQLGARMEAVKKEALAE
jgi:hemerythrin superfamily protein